MRPGVARDARRIPAHRARARGPRAPVLRHRQLRWARPRSPIELAVAFLSKGDFGASARTFERLNWRNFPSNHAGISALAFERTGRFSEALEVWRVVTGGASKPVARVENWRTIAQRFESEGIARVEPQSPQEALNWARAAAPGGLANLIRVPAVSPANRRQRPE